MRYRYIRALKLGSTAAIALASGSAAFAQGQDVEQVVVTGSRVSSNESSPTPVTQISADQLMVTRPTTVFDGLLDLPVFTGSQSAYTQPYGAGGSSRAAEGLNLRGLGLPRTLVLYDGHRVPSTNQDGTVDVTTIPQMLLQRVDVVTGGVSAVYGSDAITGVVNYVTDRKFDGVKVNLSAGTRQHGGASQDDAGIAGGMDLFDNRVHIEGSLERHWDGGILRSQIADLRNTPSLEGIGTAASPFFYTGGGRISVYSYGGKIIGPATNPLLNYTFNANGVATPFANGVLTGNSSVQIGGDGVSDQKSSLEAPQNFNQYYGRVDYDVTDNIHFFVTSNFTQDYSHTDNTNFRIPTVTIPSTNAFLPPAYQQAMTAAGVNSFTLAKAWNIADQPGSSSDDWLHQVYLNSGLEATFGDYKFEGSFTHGVAYLKSKANGSIDDGKLAAATDAVFAPAGNSAGIAAGTIVCNVTLTNPGLYPGCVPDNIFGPSADDQTIGYIRAPRSFLGRTAMDDASGSIVGAPFSTWAGPVNMALSGEWRLLSYALTSNTPAASEAPLNCTGLRFNCVTGATAQFTNSTSTRSPVYQNVSEVALEADVPLLKDDFIESANLTLGGRQTYYTNTGNAVVGTPITTTTFAETTWKIGLDASINDEWRLRGTRSHDIRAPNLNELFMPTTLTNTPYTDILTGSLSTANQYTGGNIHLTPEIGDTETAGFVYQPAWLENLSIDVDAFNIGIKNSIQQVAGWNIAPQQSCYASGGTSFYCTLQVRPLGYSNTSIANAVTTWYSGPLNIALQRTYGMDFEANYSTELYGRPFSIRALTTYQPHAFVQQPGTLTVDAPGVTQPVWRMTGYFRYRPTDDFTIDVLEKWRSGLQNADPALGFVFRSNADRDVKSISDTNVTFTYSLTDMAVGPVQLGQTDLFLNIVNLFDQNAPQAALGNAGTQGEPGRADGFVVGDDVLGRYFTIGLRLKTD